MTIFPTKRGWAPARFFGWQVYTMTKPVFPSPFWAVHRKPGFFQNHGNSTSNDGFLLVKVLTSRDVWFLQVLAPGDSKWPFDPFWSPSWRSLSYSMGHLPIPKRSLWIIRFYSVLSFPTLFCGVYLDHPIIPNVFFLCLFWAGPTV